MASYSYRVTTLFALSLLLQTSSVFAQNITEEEQNTIVIVHNTYRAQHCVSPLTWSSELAASAQKWASKCKAVHGRHGRFGENLAWGDKRTAASAVQSWYKGASKYNYSKPGFRHGIGHFTQMIWKGSKRVGCGVATCPSRLGRFWVCRYAPAGNWFGRFKKNVPKRCR
jgi:uncharacterized protein YkwD